jgi:transcriptional regulator with XRE-family HTH domain
MTGQPHEVVVGEIRAVMARKRITQVKLAADLGVHVDWLKRRLNGLVPLSIDDTTMIANGLGVTVSQLMQPLDDEL